MKSKEEVSSELELEKKNNIFQLWKSLKDSIFNVLFVLLDSNDGEEESTLSVYYQAGADYFQMFEFPFNSAVQAAWNGGDTLTKITAFVNVFSIVSYLPTVGFDTFLAQLYVLIVAIIIIIVDIVYVSYSFSKKRFRFTWPLVILCKVVPLFVTVFFIPITEILLSVAGCNASPTNPSIQVMSQYPEVVCWEGWHLFHSVVTLIFCSIFIFISTIVALAMFEPRMSSKEVKARQNSNAEIAFIVNKIVCQFIFNFVPFDNTWVYAVMLFILSGWLFYTYNVRDPYYNKSVSKFFRICSCYYFWTNFMLVVSQLLQNFDFQGGLVAWIGGLPFIAIIIIFQKKPSIETLFSSNLKFRSGNELEAHLKNVLMLIQTQETDKNSYMLLIGYIENHKQVCNEEDCPLKVSRKKKDNDVGEMEQNCKQLLKQLDRMYQAGIRKYPTSTKLRLSYAFFHLERTKNKSKAYQEFVRAEKTDPNFSQQFIIYRFKKIIKENLQNEQDQQDNADLIELIRFDNHVSLCQESMVLSVRLHKEFWTELREETPDLTKLNQIGSKITRTVQSAKTNFNQLVKIQSFIPEVLHNYAVYLISVLQEPIAGVKILEMSKKAEQEKLFIQVGKEKGKNYLEKFESEQVAMLVISAREQSLGKIVRSNLIFTEVFGYFKEQILEWKLSKLLPEMYSQIHHEFLYAWIGNSKEKSKYLSTSHQGFLRQKTGYIVPVTYEIAYNAPEEQFLAHFRLEHNQKKSYGYMLTDPRGVLKDVSASIFSFFNIGKDEINKLGVTLKDILPGVMQDVANYEQPHFVDYEYRDKKDRCLVMVQKIQISVKKQVPSMKDSGSKTIAENQILIGYKVRLERVEKKKPSQMRQQVTSRNESFQRQATNSELLRLYNQEQLYQYDYVEQTDRSQIMFTNFGVKIKTLRLTNNQLHMIYNGNDSDDFDNDFEQSDDQNLGKVRFDDDRYTQVIKNAINTNLDHIQVVFLRRGSFIFLIVLSAVLTASMLMTSKAFDKVSGYTEELYHKGLTIMFYQDMLTNALLPDGPIISYQEAVTRIDNFSNQIDPPTNLSITLQDGSIIYKSFDEGFVFILGRLRAFYSNQSSPQSLTFTLNNFIYSVGTFLISYQPTFPTGTNFWPYVCLALVVVLSLSICLLWIAVILKIKKKRFDILIWFLDIPIPYVTYLSHKCDKFLKSFAGMRDPIVQDKTVQLFQEYVDKKDQGENEIQEQHKARKSLIARHKKKKLLSRLNSSFFKNFLLIAVCLAFPIFNLVTLNNTVSSIEMLRPQFQQNVRQAQTISGLNFAEVVFISDLIPSLGTLIIDYLKATYSGSFSRNNLKEFNLQILSSHSQLATIYENIYFRNMCLYLDNDVQADCEQALEGNLGRGALSLELHISSKPVDQLNQTEFLHSNFYYIQPTFGMLSALFRNTIVASIQTCLRQIDLFLYIYIVCMFLVFVTFWLMWLRGLNRGLNQTIQMLNMIPLKVLPSSNKETKRFIRWIIRESNKKKHDD